MTPETYEKIQEKKEAKLFITLFTILSITSFVITIASVHYAHLLPSQTLPALVMLWIGLPLLGVISAAYSYKVWKEYKTY